MTFRQVALACCCLIAAPAWAQSAPAPAPLQRLIAEALASNPEVRAARNEADAARHRIGPAGALDDPMVEAGLLNVPTNNWRLNREDMTMKMLGLSQKLPFPGKRALRQEVAERDAGSVAHGVGETENRVARDVAIAYFDLALATESARQLRENTRVLEQFRRIAESRYGTGQGTQADALKAQTQLAKMTEELLRMEREIPALEAEVVRLVGGAPAVRLEAPMPELPRQGYDLAALRESALRRRPQLLALRELADKAELGIDLARRDYQPDFDVRVSYGQRENMLDGTRRPDMVSVIVGINVPIWGKEKIEPRVAEARAMRDQARSLHLVQQNETFARLRQQVAIAEQSRRSVELYDTAILPQASLTVESALASYRVSRTELLMLLDSQMSLYNYRIGRAAAVVAAMKAHAEIQLLAGTPMGSAGAGGTR